MFPFRDIDCYVPDTTPSPLKPGATNMKRPLNIKYTLQTSAFSATQGSKQNHQRRICIGLSRFREVAIHDHRRQPIFARALCMSLSLVFDILHRADDGNVPLRVELRHKARRTQERQSRGPKIGLYFNGTLASRSRRALCMSGGTTATLTAARVLADVTTVLLAR